MTRAEWWHCVVLMEKSLARTDLLEKICLLSVSVVLHAGQQECIGQ